MSQTQFSEGEGLVLPAHSDTARQPRQPQRRANRSVERVSRTPSRARTSTPAKRTRAVRQVPPGQTRFKPAEASVAASNPTRPTRTTKPRASASAETRTQTPRTTRSRTPSRGATRSAETFPHGHGRIRSRQVFKGSILPSLKQRQAIWANFDFSREEPHLSPSFIAMKLKRRKPTRGQQPQSAKRVKKATLKPRTDALKVIPLGGLCEVGRNMTALEYGQDLIVVDAGVSFPDENQPGIDSVIPNMQYIFDNLHKLRGIFITHGHEDHIGSLPWLMKKVQAPVYTTPLPAALIRNKLVDKGVKGKHDLIREVRAGDRIKAGCMEIEYIHVNHSIADACALAIRTPAGTVVHTGDFKVDYTPIDAGPIDLPRLATIGAEGVLLLLCESTNVERPGFSPSERVVGESFADIFAEATGRIFVATFSSNVYRVQQIIDAAERHHRKVALIGRSMQSVFQAADSLGYIRRQPDTIIDLHEIDHYEPEELVIITTGSQGEPMAALTRMATDQHRTIEIDETDTVVISATPIPGNEKPLYRVINELYKRGAKVVYSSLAHIHVSGHAYREEIKLMHQLIQPKYFMPVHGEYRMLHIHAQLAHDLGQPWDSIFMLNNGDILQISDQGAGILASLPAEPVLIDGKSSTTLDNAVLESRRTMAEEGLVCLSLCVDAQGQGLACPPAFESRGFVYANDLQAIQKLASDEIDKFVNRTVHAGKPLAALLRSEQFADNMKSVLANRTQRKPIVVVSVLEL